MPLNMIIGIALLVASVARLVVMFVWLNRISDTIREKRPSEWAAHNGSGYVGRYAWVGQLMLGTVKLDIPDHRYRRYLSSARWRLGDSMVFFWAGLVVIVWPA